MDLRSYRIVTAPFYENGRATDYVTATGHPGKGKANAEANREQMLAEISARMDADTKSSRAEMRSKICAFQSELEESIQHEMKAVIQPIRSELDETTACNAVTD
jgi:hypothetical protein